MEELRCLGGGCRGDWEWELVVLVLDWREGCWGGVRTGRRMLEAADAGVRVAGTGGAEAGRTGAVGAGEADVEGNGGRGRQRTVGLLGVLRRGCL